MARLRADLFNPWTLLGAFFLLLGAAGVILPLLPTTPFVLLAAGCFARSSPRLHRWLLDSALFGPVLRDWENKHCVSCRVKRFAIGMMVLVGGSSVYLFVPRGWPLLAALGLIGVGCVVVLSLQTCAPDLANRRRGGMLPPS